MQHPQPSSPQKPTKSLPRPPHKGRRRLVSDRKQKRLLLFEQRLIWIQDKYPGLATDLADLGREFTEPEFAQILQAAQRSLPGAVDAAHQLAHRDRRGDSDAVSGVLDRWAVVSVEEICDDTGLSSWAVRLVLKDFEARGLLEVTKDSHDADGCPGKLYAWKR